MKRATASVLLGLALVTPALAQQGDEPDDKALENLAKQLVEKRAEVERMANRLELEKSELQSELRSLALQKADLERKLKALQVDLDDVSREADKQDEEITAKQKRRQALKPVVLGRIKAAASYVSSSLPFKRTERLAELKKLRLELEQDDVAPDEALSRLWSTLEDELRLTRENGKYRQQIEIDGERQLADVVKLGTVLMYFRTLDGRYGLVERTNDGWTYKHVKKPAEQEMIGSLFAAVEKHIREGYFELPNPLGGESRVAKAKGGAR